MGRARVCVRVCICVYACDCIVWCKIVKAKGGVADHGVVLHTKQSRRRDEFSK